MSYGKVSVQVLEHSIDAVVTGMKTAFCVTGGICCYRGR